MQKYGAPVNVGSAGAIGQGTVAGGIQSSGYGIRNIQSSKGMNRPQQNNLMMS
jgi:broad specificity polyphosphatase/5'/3'-nucleotidase SurE